VSVPGTFEGRLSPNCLERASSVDRTLLALFIQQKLTSVFPMAYYVATLRDLNSLMDGILPRNTMLPPEILQSAITGSWHATK